MINLRAILYFAGVLAIALIVLFFAFTFSNIFAYITISLVIATILKPLTNYFHRARFLKLRLPRVVAVLLSFATLITVIASFVVLFIPLISDQVEVISGLSVQGQSMNIQSFLEQVETWMIDNKLAVEPGFITTNIDVQQIVTANLQNVQSLLGTSVSLAAGFSIGLLAVTFITFFLLYEQGLIKQLFLSLIPNRYFEVYIAAVYKTETLLTNYLTGLLLQMLSIFSLAALGLRIVGIEYALTIAAFAAVANVIPYAGPILGSMFGIVVGLLNQFSQQIQTANANIYWVVAPDIGTLLQQTATADGYWLLVAKILIVFAVVQLTDNLVLQPLIFSKSVKAHPLEIFVIIFVGANLAGIIGMIAAIPVYTIVRVSAIEIYRGYNTYSIFRN